LHAVLWLFLAQARSGFQTAITNLEANAARGKSTEWPYPIIEMFLGRRTEQATLGLAGSPSERCEAEFFVAEQSLLRADRTIAIDRLRSAVDICPKSSVALPSVQAELKRKPPLGVLPSMAGRVTRIRIVTGR
jgi:hypothetical protein